MAGIENSIVFGGGFKLEASSSRDISDMQRTSTDVSRINHTGNPEGVVSANPSSLLHDPVSGIVYIKSTGTGNTGWLAIPTSSGASYIDGVTSWVDVTGTSQALAVNTGYLANNSSLVTLTLPATAAKFTVIKILGFGSGGWSVAQNSGQSIILGAKGVTTTGATGSVSSTNRYDEIELMCVVADTTWVAKWNGNLTPA